MVTIAVLFAIATGVLVDALSLDFRGVVGLEPAQNEVRSARPLPSALSSHWSRELRKNAGTTGATIESVTVAGKPARVVLGSDAIIDVPVGGTATVKGWAVDSDAETPAGGVLVQIDDSTPVFARYGAPRPDVATAMGNPALEPSGYESTIHTRTLHAGVHAIRILVLDAQRTGYYIVPSAPTRIRLAVH